MYISFYEMVQIIHNVSKHYDNLTKENPKNQHHKKVAIYAKGALRKVEREASALMKKKYNLKK
ncbi:hypothetical protein CMI37_28450 [Candidatus Pacearchaeota archaeon]|nr:hypothetical protein [Candidatus Pacearchaeota archaeon]|tara:strand:+ start:243 stop:431 length:189 start_codon:yes stop_codon:yes gene_type:complete